MAYSDILTEINRSRVFAQTFNSIPEALEKKLTVTGTLDVQKWEYRTLNQNQKLTFTDTNIGNFGTAPFSVRVYDKINSYTNIGSTINIIMGKGTLFTDGFFLGISNMSTLVIYIRNTTFNTTYTIDPTKYYDIVITREGQVVNIFVNGVLAGTNTNAVFALTVDGSNFRISADSGTARYIKQSVKLVELYNKALASDEILAIYNNSKPRNYNPIMDLRKWTKSSGVYKEEYQTTNDPIVPKGQKIFTCTTTGNIGLQNNKNIGTWELSFKKTTDGSNLYFGITDGITSYTIGAKGYYFVVRTTEALAMFRSDGISGSALFSSDVSLVELSKWYRLRVTRTEAGVFTMYIKGNAFGSNWVLVSATGGAGTNPTTSTAYNSFVYMVLALTGTDQVSDIRFYPYIKTN